MIEARKASMWTTRYDLVVDGLPLATWDASWWKPGGAIEIDGRRYEVRTNLWGSTYGMADQDGARIASADRVGRKSWRVEADGVTYEFRRPSAWRQEEELLADGQPVGSVRRTSAWRGDAVADLPGLPLAVQVFVLAVVLATWDTAGAAANA
ncbi:hypothetical protein [Pengzhenrongella phosphoraccumulans]|uniref:hypothetical protein n=1 Tax=Pengzhenrongella phosphoraccumulans TaxID=3114394 RepID=UPI00388E020B